MTGRELGAWFPVAGPPMPQTCVACGGVCLRGFVFCGWCGAPLNDDTQIAIPLPVTEAAPELVRTAALSYAIDPVDFPGSEKITLVHWPADDRPAQEITQPSRPIQLDQPDPHAPAEDTDPRRGLPAPARRGLCVVVLGRGPAGMHRPPTEVQILGVGDELDVITGESGGATTTFKVVPEGLRVCEVGAARGVSVRIPGQVGLRTGDAFRLGQSWLCYASAEGREAWGMFGRVYVLAPSGHVITQYEVGQAGLVLGRGFGDPTLACDASVAPAHCRIIAGPGGAVLEDLGSPDGTFVAVTEGELIPVGSIASFADVAVRLDPIA